MTMGWNRTRVTVLCRRPRSCFVSPRCFGHYKMFWTSLKLSILFHQRENETAAVLKAVLKAVELGPQPFLTRGPLEYLTHVCGPPLT